MRNVWPAMVHISPDAVDLDFIALLLDLGYRKERERTFCRIASYFLGQGSPMTAAYWYNAALKSALGFM